MRLSLRLTFAALLTLLSWTSLQAATYTANATIKSASSTGNGESMGQKTAEVTDNSDGTYTIVFKELTYSGFGFGDFTFSGVTGKTGSDGITRYSYSGSASISNVTDGTVSLWGYEDGATKDGWTLTGQSKDDALYLNLQGALIGNASMIIEFGTKIGDDEDTGAGAISKPVISGSPSFEGSTEISITAGEGYSIFYTTDGQDPTTESTLYSAPFTITKTTTVKAIAASADGSEVSSIAEATFTNVGVNAPVINIDSTDPYADPTTFTLTSDDPDATLFYQITSQDDEQPSAVSIYYTNGQVYQDSAVEINSGKKVWALARKYVDGTWKNSPIVSAEYTAKERPQGLSVPYSCDFSTQDDFNTFTVLNEGKDGPDNTYWQWVSYYKYAQCNKMYGTVANDYLVTPAIHFEEGNVYSLTFSAEGGNNKEILGVYLSDGATLEAVQNGKELLDTTGLGNNGLKEYNVKFPVDYDGTLNIAFRYHENETGGNGDGIRISLDDISVVSLGKTNAPKAVTGLDIIPDVNGALKAEVAFKAPTEQYDGEALASIDKIVITRNGKEINTITSPAPGANISFVDSIIPSVGNYTYSVAAYNENGAGESTEAAEYIGATVPPLTFDGAFDGFTFSNANTDTGWKYNDDKTAVIYDAINDGKENDRMTTPYFRLKKGDIVKMSFVYDVYNEDASTSQLGFWIGICNIDNPEKTNNIMPLYWVRAGEKDKSPDNDYRFTINDYVGGDGTYAFYMYTLSPSSNNTGIIIKKLTIDTDNDPGAPDKVTDIKITPAANGKLEGGTFSFKMPTTTLGGDALEGAVGVRIYDPKQNQIAEIPLSENVQPGADAEVQATLTQGVQTYSIRTFNEKGLGSQASWAAFAGVDVPLRVRELRSYPSEDNNSVELTWQKPDMAEHNGWYDESQLRYNIYVDSQYVATTKDMTYTYTIKSQEQKEYDFAVTPVTDAGEGIQPATHFNFLGTPLPLPFSEDFAGGEYHTAPWHSEGTPYTDCFFKPYADFNGSPALVHAPYTLVTSYAWTPKISFKDVEKAELSFDYYHYSALNPSDYPAAKSQLTMDITTDDNNYETVVNEYADCPKGQEGWYSHKADLSKFAGKNWIGIRIYGNAGDKGEYVAIRNLKVEVPESDGINSISNNPLTISTGDGTISVNGAVGKVDVYDLNGRLISSTSRTYIKVAPGVYIIKNNGKAIKAVIR